MAVEVKILVTFACDSFEGIATLARKHLPALEARREAASPRWGYNEAVAFLTELASRSGQTAGPKNGLFTWSYGGDHTLPNVFVEALQPFWEEMLTSHIDGGPFLFSHILVLSQYEARQRIDAIEIFLDLPPKYHLTLPKERPSYSLTVRRHIELPFSWG